MSRWTTAAVIPARC